MIIRMRTSMPNLTAIAAMANNRVIGHQGQMPWHYPEDLKWFKRVTMSHPVLMGRKTFDSLQRPLPGRQNIVLSSAMVVPPPGGRHDVAVIRSIDELPDVAEAPRVFVIGGAQVYQALLPLCEDLLLTCIDEEPEGDTFMPPFEELFDEVPFGDVWTKHPGTLTVRRYVRRPTQP